MKHFVPVIVGICFVSLSLVSSASRPVLAQQEAEKLLQRSEIEKLRKENEVIRQQLQELRLLLENLRAERETEEQPEKEAEVTAAEEPGIEPVAEQAKVIGELEEAIGHIGMLTGPDRPKAEEDFRSYMEQMEQLNELGRRIESLQRYLSLCYPDPAETARPYADYDKGAVGAAYSHLPANIHFASREMQLEDVMLSHGDVGLATMLRFEKVKVYRKLKEYDRAIRELRAIIGGNLSEVITNAARWTLVEVLQEKKEKDAATAELEKILATTKDTRKKKDAIYGIINLLGDDPQSKLRAIERLINRLEGRPETGYGPPGITFPGPTPGHAAGVVPVRPAIGPAVPDLFGPTGPTLPGEVTPVDEPVAPAQETLPEPTARPPMGPSPVPDTLSQPGAPSPAPGTGIPEPISPAPRPTAPSEPSQR